MGLYFPGQILRLPPGFLPSASYTHLAMRKENATSLRSEFLLYFRSARMLLGMQQDVDQALACIAYHAGS